MSAHAIVTGGARGIGLAIATRLAERGDLVTIADVRLEEAERSAEGLCASGHAATAVQLDVTQTNQVFEVLAKADARAALTTVVCNAGVGFASSFEATREEDYDALMAVNVKGVFFVTQAAVRLMLPRGHGSVVSIASTSGFTASNTPMAAYDASKAAVRMITQSAAREVASSGIRVNAVAPGTVGTTMVREVLTPESVEYLCKYRIPMGRLAEPHEIAQAVAFLSSDEATYVTGHTLVVDGGWLT